MVLGLSLSWLTGVSVRTSLYLFQSTFDEISVCKVFWDLSDACVDISGPQEFLCATIFHNAVTIGQGSGPTFRFHWYPNLWNDWLAVLVVFMYIVF
jgi:hypothetical protein